MINNVFKKDILTYILTRCCKCSCTVNDKFVVLDILKKSVTTNLSIYVNFGSSIIGKIENIKIIDNENNEIFIDDRVFEKNSDDILTINISINEIEVV